MVWQHKSRMYWISKDIAGIIVEVKIVDGISYYQAISEETGEIFQSEQHGHPLEAMSCAQRLQKLTKEVSKTKEVLK